MATYRLVSYLVKRASVDHQGGMERSSEPKRRNAVETKARILASAQRVFSTRGYAASGIRDIAEPIGLSSTIVIYYFKTKAQLFEIALQEALDVRKLLPSEMAVQGRGIADLLASPDLDINPHAMIVMAASDEGARDIAIRVLKEHVLTPLANRLGPPHAEDRALEIMALCTGFVVYTRQLALNQSANGVDSHVSDWLAKQIQNIIDRDER